MAGLQNHMKSYTEIIFQLEISADEYVRYYKGTAKTVVTQSIDGKKVQFPVNILQSYITHNGISGMFSLKYDENNKYVSIQKID